MGDSDFKSSERQFLKTSEESLFAVCMSLRRIPTITYSLEGPLGRKIAERLSARLEREYTQNHREFLQESLELLIFDRKEDPVTPLVYDWGYQAMVHEFIGIENNAVKLAAKLDIFARDADDEFLDLNWAKNYGEFTKEMSEDLERLFKERNESTANMKTMEDFQRVMEKMPNLTKEAQQVNKHSGVIRALTDHVQNSDIYTVSQLQQDITTENNKSGQFKDLLTVLTKKTVNSQDKVKLVMLYCLKYSDDPERVMGLQRAISAQNLSTVRVFNLGTDSERSGILKTQQTNLKRALLSDWHFGQSLNRNREQFEGRYPLRLGRRQEHLRETRSEAHRLPERLVERQAQEV